MCFSGFLNNAHNLLHMSMDIDTTLTEQSHNGRDLNVLITSLQAEHSISYQAWQLSRLTVGEWRVGVYEVLVEHTLLSL